MEETIGSATLVEAAPEVEANGVTTTLPRAEVEEVLRTEDGPVELFLDLLRPADDEARTVRIAWDHADLERILEASSGDTVTLAFDRRELETAFEEADVEGHGLRERALVLTVAVATAATGASVASAAVDSGATGATGGQSPAQVTGGAWDTPGGYGMSGVTGGAVGAAGEQSPAEVTGGAAPAPSMEGYQRAMPSDYGVTTGPVGAAGDQSPAEVTGGAGEVIGGAVGAAGDQSPAEVTGGAGSQQPEFTPGVSDFPSPGVQQQPAGEGGGISIPEPARDAAIAGGLALLITAAGFALKGQRRRVEPA